MTKQLVFMVLMTVLGTVGVYLFNPFYGVLVYYIFGVLRPPELWIWALPEGIPWSFYVGVATLLAAFFSAINGMPDPRPPAPTRPLFGYGHFAMLAFGVWIWVAYYLAQNQNVAHVWFMEYLKIFLMFAASAVIIRSVNEIRMLMMAVTIAVIYLGVDINVDYLASGSMKVYFHGHGGLDNNGAGLMLAMGIPLTYFLFEALTNRWRWLLLLTIPPAIHAVQMTFSRGAMLSLLVGVPLIVARSRYRKWLLIATLTLGPPLVLVTAGKEIRDRFFSIETAREVDGSAKARLQSWEAALRIAWDYPTFGVGIRNSNLFSHRYGADMEGRTIHSTYLQLAADAGFVGVGLYLFALAIVWHQLRTVRRATRGKLDDESKLYYGLACGVECALAVLCFGSLFLSLEVFELPYCLLLCGSQLALLYAHRHGKIYDPNAFALPPVPVSASPLAESKEPIAASAR